MQTFKNTFAVAYIACTSIFGVKMSVDSLNFTRSSLFVSFYFISFFFAFLRSVGRFRFSFVVLQLCYSFYRFVCCYCSFPGYVDTLYFSTMVVYRCLHIYWEDGIVAPVVAIYTMNCIYLCLYRIAFYIYKNGKIFSR